MKYFNSIISVVIFSTIILLSCKQNPESDWVLIKEISIDDFSPVGITNFRQYVCVSDSSRDKVYFVDTTDYSLFLDIDVEQPMYINVKKSRLLIPSFDKDTVFVFRGNELYPIETFGVLDGSIGVDAEAIWKYAQVSYNDHLIHYRNDELDYLLGGKGSDPGELLYPSNVVFIDSSIYVVDSGNKRIQVYDKEGNFDFLFGEEMNFEWPTGISYSDSLVFVSDAQLNEIFVFDYRGRYQHSITQDIDGPSDLEYFDSKLYVANQNGPQIKIFKPNIKK